MFVFSLESVSSFLLVNGWILMGTDPPHPHLLLEETCKSHKDSSFLRLQWLLLENYYLLLPLQFVSQGIFIQHQIILHEVK